MKWSRKSAFMKVHRTAHKGGPTRGKPEGEPTPLRGKRPKNYIKIMHISSVTLHPNQFPDLTVYPL